MHALPIIATEEQLIHMIQQSDERPFGYLSTVRTAAQAESPISL
ncbi:hypothetical protein [Paenibacillus alvei]|nr:hypothetical protein [Paenibacillus alvei]